MAAQLHTLKLTIEAGSALTGTVGSGLDITGLRPVFLILPGDWTPADITFSVGPDDVNYGWLSDDDGVIIKIPNAAANRGYLLPSSWFAGANFMVLISGDVSVAQVNQVAARELALICEVL